jgi:hypothetical protein
MRLREVLSIVQELKEEIVFPFFQLSNGKMRVNNYKQCIAKIDKLDKIGLIDDEMERLRELEFVYHDKSSSSFIDVDTETLKELRDIERLINKKIEAIIDVSKISLPTEKAESIDVKLPEFKTLSEASKFFNDLNKALEIAVVNKDINGKVELQNFESGSLWVSIYLGTSTAVSLIGSLVKTALNLKGKYYETEKLKSAARSMDVVLDMQEKLLEAIDKELENAYKTQATELLAQSPIQDDSPEFTTKFVHVVSTFADLIYRGAEIHASLTASKEDRETFPVFPKLGETALVKSLQEPTESEQVADESTNV